MITLKAHGVVTHWEFPKRLRTCPITSCRKFSDDRSGAIDHFKLQHAENSILCSLCNKPVYCKQKSHYASHYRSLHPEVKQIPFDFGQQREHSMKRAGPTKKYAFITKSKRFLRPRFTNNFLYKQNNKKVNASIILRGCSQVTRWLVSETLKECPMNGCRKVFETQKLFITHFKEQHAKEAILCKLCVKPITAKYKISFIKHYKSNHLGEEVPFGLKNPQIRNRRTQARHV